jgi:coproporphyrinogen III oxidase-like Fe-S oxidoreductase
MSRLLGIVYFATILLCIGCSAGAAECAPPDAWLIGQIGLFSTILAWTGGSKYYSNKEYLDSSDTPCFHKNDPGRQQCVTELAHNWSDKSRRFDLFEYVLRPYFQYLNKRSMRFDPVSSDRLPVAGPGSRHLLYVHIPFCESLCPFCCFHRVLLERPKADYYFEALRQEIRWYKESGFEFVDMYIGGGTPTVIPDQLIETIELIRSLFPIEKISVETNPNHLQSSTLDSLRRVGVNRLSVGVQSFDDQLLKDMGRYQSYGSGAQILERLKAAYGVFDTLNVDMIFNQPHQTTKSLDRDIEFLLDNEIADQVSFYPIMPAATTARLMRRAMGTISLRNERAMYRQILEGVQPKYQPSTVWCFNRNRNRDLVDEYIVDHDNYIGVGSGAFSYVAGRFYSSSFSIDRYIETIRRGRTGIVKGRQLTEVEQLRYRFLVGLFGLELDWESVCREHQVSGLDPLWKERLFFSLLGSIRKDGSIYRLTNRGMYHWLVMMREFLTGVDNFRNEMRAHIGAERMLEKVFSDGAD